MTRIVAGSAGGRKIQVPKSGTRPTSDKVREAVFSRLTHRGYVVDCAVLDLFSGSGAIALEAKSRGAGKVVCVEAHRPAVEIIRRNARDLGLQIEIFNQRAQSYLETSTDIFDMVYIDPPYALAEAELAQLLETLVGNLASDAIVLVERAKASPAPSWPKELAFEDERSWGDTRVWSAVRLD